MTNATVIRTRTIVTRQHTATLLDGTEVDLPIGPACEHIDPVLTEDGTTLRYAVQDDSCHDYEWQEGVEFVQGNMHYLNYASDPDGWIEDMSPDHDLYPVDVYEHGNILYSLSGGGPQCAFDTARGGACIAIPNEKHDNPFTNTREAAAAILAEYSAWCNGDVYGIVEVTIDPATGEVVGDYDDVWGIIGWEYAEECLKNGY